jgi:hypothetical protein
MELGIFESDIGCRSGYLMRAFDLFRQFGPQKALWIQDFAKLDDAVSEMKKLALKGPGLYYIYGEVNASTVSRTNSESLPKPQCLKSALPL